MANFLVFEENTKVSYVAAIADKTAPTASEVTAGVALEEFITKDGVQTSPTNNRVDSATIDTAYDSQLMGSYKYDLALRFKVADASAEDTPWSTLGTRKTLGFVVVSLADSISTAGDEVHVFPIETGSPEFPNSAANEQKTWTCPCAVTSEPALRVQVAA